MEHQESGCTSFCSPRKAAQTLGIRLDAVYGLIWAGRLQAEKRDGRWLVSQSAVEARVVGKAHKKIPCAVGGVNMTQSLSWKLRRVTAGIRQQDIALRTGMSTTRYSAIERGEHVASELETRLIDQFLFTLVGGTNG